MQTLQTDRPTKKIWSFVLIVLISVLAVAGLSFALKAVFNFSQPPETDQPLIGGETDGHGCLVAAGYSWCAAKDKCLRAWEEPCLSQEEEDLVKAYISQNISALSPRKEVLGGQFYVTQFRFTQPGQVVVDYEDGHIALQGQAEYEISGNNVDIKNFFLLDGDGKEDSSSPDSAEMVVERMLSDIFGLDPEKTDLAYAEVAWNSEGGEAIYDGVGISQSDTDTDRMELIYRDLSSALSAQGFAVDGLNSGSQTALLEQARFISGSVVCNISKQVLDEGDSKIVEIKCADLP